MNVYFEFQKPNVKVGDTVFINKGEGCNLSDTVFPRTAIVSKVDEWGVELENHYYSALEHGEYTLLNLQKLDDSVIDAWNSIGCQSFSREALGEERWNKIIEEGDKILADKVGLGIKFIEVLNEDMTADEVVTHLKIYKNDELYVEVTDYSPYANKDYMSKSLRKALKGGKTLTYEQNKELQRFKASKVLHI